jgi:signal transduction histidine kinase
MRVLLVEDNLGDARLLREALVDAGSGQFELAHVEQLSTALQRLGEEHFDAILLDLSLSDERGLDTLKRAREQAPGVPVIVLTGIDDEELAVKAVREGAQDYLVKGQVDGNLLVRSMRYAVERKRAEEQVQRNFQQLVAMREIYLAVSSTLDRDTLLQLLLEKVDQFLASSAVSTIMLYNNESGLLDIQASRNVDEGEWKSHLSRNGTGLLDLVFRTRAPLVISDLQTGPLVNDQEFFHKHKVVAYFGVPLVTNEEFFGVLTIFLKEEHQFSDEEIDYYSTLAGQAAMAIHNSYLYEETRELARELMTANKVKSEFLSVMSHELRTPLHVIMGHTGMVCDKMLGEINEKQESSLTKAMSSSRELLSMINSILEATRMEAEAVNVDQQELNAGKFLSELQLAYDVPMNKDLILAWDYPSNLPAMRTDSGKLKQILQNLINNAIKFTEKGSVTISAKYLPAIAAMEFKVADTGIGIPKKAIPLIFDKFRQLDSSDTRAYGGVGLGLYIIKKFTDLLGGTVKVETEPGQGTTFVVTVPI